MSIYRNKMCATGTRITARDIRKLASFGIYKNNQPFVKVHWETSKSGKVACASFTSFIYGCIVTEKRNQMYQFVVTDLRDKKRVITGYSSKFEHCKDRVAGIMLCIDRDG